MDIQSLQTFYVVSQELNYTRASEILFISRQAVCQTIRKLEKETGQPLFFAQHKRLCLTPFGTKFLPYVQDVLSSFEHLTLFLSESQSDNCTRFRIAMGKGSFMIIPPQLFWDFQKEHPSIQYEFIECSDTAAKAMLAEGKADLAILGSQPKWLTDYQSALLHSDPIYLQVSAKNPLSRRNLLHPHDLISESLVSLGNECDMHRFLVELCEEAGFSPHMLLITQDSNTANNMVIENQAVTLGHKQTQSMNRNPDIRLIPMDIKTRQWGTYAISLKNRNLPGSLRLLIRFLQQHC